MSPTNEERLAAIEATLGHLATKEDVQALESKLLRWIVATGLGIAAVTATLAATITRYIIP